MASAFGICSSGSSSSFSDALAESACWLELLRKTEARSMSRDSASAGVITSARFNFSWSGWEMNSLLPTGTIYSNLKKLQIAGLDFRLNDFAPPTRLFVQGRLRKPAQGVDGPAICHYCIG